MFKILDLWVLVQFPKLQKSIFDLTSEQISVFADIGRKKERVKKKPILASSLKSEKLDNSNSENEREIVIHREKRKRRKKNTKRARKVELARPNAQNTKKQKPNEPNSASNVQQPRQDAPNDRLAGPSTANNTGRMIPLNY